MKLCRFNEKGVAAVRELLPQIKTVDDLARAEALVSNADLIDPIPALADIDLDASRIFPTTFAFCEYFHSLMKDHKPLAYRTDVGFWTWLAMVYVRQLVHIDNSGRVVCGAEPRLVYSTKSYVNAHRHLLALPYYLYCNYSDGPELTKTILVHSPNSVSDLVEQIIARQSILQNPAIMRALKELYFDNEKNCPKPGAGGDGAGAVRRFVAMVDQFGMTMDCFEQDDANAFLAVLPKEFERFHKKV